ncbi:ATP-dependent DNA ligase [Nocardioides terrigena]|uniref:ATP-dependent DNA ligase n=1 Tax=Nocardioides terrigena TaxID=424797 RepID=UPI000D2FD2DF|nr:ATP-dependent DNA ligase [Nocardioides terrigena]
MLLADLVATSQAVSATRSRKAKAASLAEALRQAEPGELETVVAYLGGTLRQRRTGLGWRGLSDLPAPAPTPTLTVSEVHAAFDAISAIAGAGSQAARKAAVADLFGRATADEQAWLRGLVTGEVRQGALDAQVQEAVAVVAEVPLTSVRRAAMLAGSTLAAAVAAFEGGEEALSAIGLEVGRPVLPMLASSAPDITAALDKMAGAPVAIDAKLDGIRIQVHRDGDDVLVVTRSLDDITGRLPEVVEIARSLPAQRFVLDGEALLLADDGRPRPFQETSSRTAQAAGGGVVVPYFFDVLHVDGRDLLDEPGRERLATLDALVPPKHRVGRLVTDDPAAAQEFVATTLAAGHEGVVVKHLDARYEAGRRGAGWIKVKPVHTLDLVVLAVEWGSGRRQGWLSNIHLGARDPEGGFVMLGKTFKGLDDRTLRWQTERFTELKTEDNGWVVRVRPEQVVEIAFDGVQRSSRYPGGVALRFARVIRYRSDKTPDEADTIAAVRAFIHGTSL